MKEKIVDLMKNEGLSSSRLAEILEIQPSGISHIVSGRNKPRFDLLQKILRRFPQINPDWLLLDDPNMYRQEKSDALPSSVDLGETSPLDLFSTSPSQTHSVDQNWGGKKMPFSDDILGSLGSPNQSPNQSPIQGQNRGENRGQIPSQFRASSPSVERIIVLYSDHTFTTYEMR